MRGHLHCRFDEGEASVKEAQCLLPFRIPRFIPLGGTRAAFPPEPTRSRGRAGSAGQGRPLGRPATSSWRGRLDGRVIRRATMMSSAPEAGLRCDKVRVALVMVGSIEAPQGRPDIPSPPATSGSGQFVCATCTPACLASGVIFCPCVLLGCALRPRFVGDAHRRRVSDVFNSPEHPARTIGRVPTTPPRAPLWGARRPAPPADPVPPVEHRSSAGRRPRSKLGQSAGASAPPAEQRGSRQLCQTHRPPWRMCEAKWRRGVGRQARQSGGEL